MIAVAVALILVGVLFLFLVPWVGLVAGIVGLLLAIAFLLGVGRETVERST